MKKKRVTFLTMLIVLVIVFLSVSLFISLWIKVENIQMYLNVLQLWVVVCWIVVAYLNYEELVRKNFKEEEILIKCINENIVREWNELKIIWKSTGMNTIWQIEIEIQNFWNTHVYFKQADVEILDKDWVKNFYSDIWYSKSNMYFKWEKSKINLNLPIHELLKNKKELNRGEYYERYKGEFLELKYIIKFSHNKDEKSLILIYKNTLMYHHGHLPTHSLKFEKQFI